MLPAAARLEGLRLLGRRRAAWGDQRRGGAAATSRPLARAGNRGGTTGPRSRGRGDRQPDRPLPAAPKPLLLRRATRPEFWGGGGDVTCPRWPGAGEPRGCGASGQGEAGARPAGCPAGPAPSEPRCQPRRSTRARGFLLGKPGEILAVIYFLVFFFKLLVFSFWGFFFYVANRLPRGDTGRPSPLSRSRGTAAQGRSGGHGGGGEGVPRGGGGCRWRWGRNTGHPAVPHGPTSSRAARGAKRCRNEKKRGRV